MKALQLKDLAANYNYHNQSVAAPSKEDRDPDWMDTSGPLGGNLKAGKISFAVSKSNVFQSNYEYTAPHGYHWATYDEFQKNYVVPSELTLSSDNQCINGRIFQSNYGWRGPYGDTYDGIDRFLFYFKDSVKTDKVVHQRAFWIDPIRGLKEFQDKQEFLFAGIVCIKND
eukprot:CAMPEP_0196765806 /NCGR_PEP_ID=MMETSP1095-20130614/13300_1 /TAXON_ID=96789 ORGANISM="Chromulina nebulosa, Strain UTEXLB2642" /NCGR_SAMPLE_ID=MMETSP1095 /ASSEMBLY_ACC=CAM_ASM_000446 /LENGTH=169 /DNA_ID=CAMNT_0042124669 /DNA_START=140 /DNA_END=649 /DNA_ORIENTATION=+